MAINIYYERNLPHFQPPYATYLVNFRIAGSLPKEALRRLQSEFELFKRSMASTTPSKGSVATYRERQFEYQMNVDRLLDMATTGSDWLRRSDLAELVSKALHFYDGVKYALLAYCIMPNHVHTLLAFGPPWIPAPDGEASEQFFVTKCIGSVKKKTARGANEILNRSGPFWQHESYDHVIRDDAEMRRILWYVILNPVSAGLVSDWKDWRWTYVKTGLL